MSSRPSGSRWNSLLSQVPQKRVAPVLGGRSGRGGLSGYGDARAAEPTPRVTDAVLKVCSLSGPTCSLLLVPPPATVSQARSAPLWLRPLLPCGPSTLACSHQPCLLSGWPWGPADQRQSLASPPTLAGNTLDRQSGQRPGPRAVPTRLVLPGTKVTSRQCLGLDKGVMCHARVTWAK